MGACGCCPLGIHRNDPDLPRYGLGRKELRKQLRKVKRMKARGTYQPPTA